MKDNTPSATPRRRGPLGWFDAMGRVFAREFRLVFSDVGIMLFFIVLPLAYPVTYTLIYNPEIVTEMPIAVVDNCRTPLSRELVRTVDASPSVSVYTYCSDMAEAKDLFGKNEVFAIMEIPRDYEKKIRTGVQATVPMYYEMSLLLRYRAFVSAMADVQIKLASDITQTRIETMGMESLTGGGDAMPLTSHNSFLGDHGQGFASFIMPGVLILILQQSMVLGICMLRGNSNERRRRNGGIDPLAVDAPAGARIWGKALCYFVIYIPMTLYVVKCVPEMFSLPHNGATIDYMLFLVPLLLASAMFGQLFSNLCTERESCFIIVVFTSIIFLFLSGLTWPRYAMSKFWLWLADLVPATWGVEGFVRINSNGATLGETSKPYLMLWLLVIVYFTVAWGVKVYINHRMKSKSVPATAE